MILFQVGWDQLCLNWFLNISLFLGAGQGNKWPSSGMSPNFALMSNKSLIYQGTNSHGPRFLPGAYGICCDACPWHTSVYVLMSPMGPEVSLERGAVDDPRSPSGSLSILFSGKQHHWDSLPYTCTNIMVHCIYRAMGYSQERCLFFSTCAVTPGRATVWTQERRRHPVHGGPPARSAPSDFWFLMEPGSTEVNTVSRFLDWGTQFINCTSLLRS